jgi:serine protease AprX
MQATNESKGRIMRTLLRVAVLLLTASIAFARNPKFGRDLDGIASTAMVDVIVQYDHVPTPTDHQNMARQGGVLTRQYRHVRAGVYRMRASGLAQVSQNPKVRYISPNRKVSGTLDNAAAAVNVVAAWNEALDGTGIGVAIIDSGINDVNDLANKGVSRVVYSQDFVGSGSHDFYGHGTHVAGILAGNGNDSICTTCTRTMKGIAPNASLINLRVLDQNGSAHDSDIIAAIDQAIALAKTYNIRVINLSVGRPVFESYTQDPLCQAVEAAWQAGIVVVVAAGNDGRDNSVGEQGYGTITVPGNDPFVITVGAMKTEGTPTRTDDLIASYSSKGPSAIDHVVKPDIVAPGNLTVSLLADINATLPTSEPSSLIPNTYYDSAGDGSPSTIYYTLSGTSMAAPVVSGAVALMLQQDPSLTPDQVKARLMRTAYKTFPASSQATDPTTGIVYSSYYDIFTIGAGYLDIGAALLDTETFTGTANSPIAVLDPTTGMA